MAIHRRQFLSYLATLAALSALPRCARAAITSRIAAQFGVLPTPENIHRVISAGPPNRPTVVGFSTRKIIRFLLA